MKKKIVVTHKLALSEEHKKRLRSLGEVTFHDTEPTTADEWLERAKGADIICSGKYGLKQKIYELQDVFVSMPAVATGWIDHAKAHAKNISFANSPGCNKEAVAEWVMGMMINLLRQLPAAIDQPPQEKYVRPQRTMGLKDKKLCVLGKGNIGSTVGRMAAGFLMQVSYFTRGDDLYKAVETADVVVNTLGLNPSTEHLLDKKFFQSLKHGSYYLTVTSDKINDVDAMIAAVDDGRLAGVATEVAGIRVNDTTDPQYQKLVQHPKVLATPHIAYTSDVAACSCFDMMIDNVEAWIKGEPQNIVQ